MDGLSPPSATAAPRGALIVDPALDLGVDLPGQGGQVRAAAAVEVPVPDLLAFRLPRCGADGRGEAGEIASWAPWPGGPGRCSRGNRSWCARSLPGGSRLCSTRS